MVEVLLSLVADGTEDSIAVARDLCETFGLIMPQEAFPFDSFEKRYSIRLRCNRSGSGMRQMIRSLSGAVTRSNRRCVSGSGYSSVHYSISSPHPW